ncbi:putative endoglucanase 1 [Diaporthe ampelina]|uniref:Glucanase n=1 Tax=Diaporthe ampelina TaxID=1214573 RepID=A0A0G2F7P2_9PEZI|nr:putative endoglucanase 1 [Diaporthe ampelina]
MLSSDGNTEYTPRVYLLNEAEDAYEMLQLTGQEFSFDVDMSKLPCGMNSALYLSEMEATGGKDSSDLSVLGAEYGAGYCDAQCYTTPFINGVGNINGSGVCCNELDIWEANARATHIAPHPCNVPGLYACDVNGEDCGADGVCDKSGCSMNPYKMGHPEYYGLDLEVDTTRPFTVVTQGVPAQNFLNDEYCNATGADKYMDLGATEGMGAAMSRGMVLVFSIWWDKGSFMEWLDGQSSNAGPCNATEGNPEVIKSIQPDTQVTFSQIRWGDIGSTFSGSTNGTGSTNGSSSAVSSLPRRRMAEGLAFHS